MQDLINTILKYLKWPMALLMMVMFFPVLNADLLLIKQTLDGEFFTRFMLPMIGVVCVWFFIPGLSGSHFAIFEHEFTHMFAALLTFHRPKSMRIESGVGGSFGYYGEGNWLITLAPYFIPTFPILMMLFSIVWLMFERRLPDMFIPVLGMLFGYHLASNASQIHGEQPDFAKAGWIFSLLFLPTANLLTFGLVWAFAARHWTGVAKWGQLVVHYTDSLVKHFF